MFKPLTKLRHNQKGFSKRRIAPIVVIAVVAAVGAYIITRGHAATTAFAGFYNSSSVSNISSGVFTTPDEVGGIGSQTVINVMPSNQLIFNNFPSKLTSELTCYYVRAVTTVPSPTATTTARAQFVGDGSSKTVNLPIDGNYHRVCVGSGSKAQLPYSVSNLSSSASLYIYQAVAQFNQ